MTPDRTTVTSTANERIKAAVRLRDRAGADGTGQTIVDGAREIARALDGGVSISEAFACRELVQTAAAEDVVARLRARDRCDRCLPDGHGQACLRRPIRRRRRRRSHTLDRSRGARAAREPLVVVVESVEKPGNLGAVLRTADGAGADAVIAADPLTDLFNPNAIRASLGTIFRVPVAAGPVLRRPRLAPRPWNPPDRGPGRRRDAIHAGGPARAARDRPRQRSRRTERGVG